MRAVTFDVYHQTYDPETHRIITRLVSGGYMKWTDAVIVTYVFASSIWGSFTIRKCAHNLTESTLEYHSAISDPDNLKSILKNTLDFD